MSSKSLLRIFMWDRDVYEFNSNYKLAGNVENLPCGKPRFGASAAAASDACASAGMRRPWRASIQGHTRFKVQVSKNKGSFLEFLTGKEMATHTSVVL